MVHGIIIIEKRLVEGDVRWFRLPIKEIVIIDIRYLSELLCDLIKSSKWLC